MVRDYKANSGRQTADSKQRTANGKQQIADRALDGDGRWQVVFRRTFDLPLAFNLSAVPLSAVCCRCLLFAVCCLVFAVCCLPPLWHTLCFPISSKVRKGLRSAGSNLRIRAHIESLLRTFGNCEALKGNGAEKPPRGSSTSVFLHVNRSHICTRPRTYCIYSSHSE